MISAYLNTTVTLKAATADKWGTKTYASTTLRARIFYGTKIVRNQSGEEIVSTTQVMIKDRTVNFGDIVTITGVDMSIVGIKKEEDFSNRILYLYLA